ncbi:MAG: SMC-Scp complex subunit ScpB [Kofleriaceae bacterium]
MSRKKSKQAVPDEVLAEGSGPVEVVAAAPAEPSEPSKKKFSKKKAPKGKKVAADAEELRTDGESSDELTDESSDEVTDELRADGAADELRADGEGPADDADQLRANGDTDKVPQGTGRRGKRHRVDGETSDEVTDELQTTGESSDELRADGATSDEIADELRGTESSEELHVDGESDADELHASEELPVDGVTSDELQAIGDSSDEATDELRADGDDAPVVEGDDVVGAPITDEAGVEAALLPGALSAVQLRHLIEALIFATDKPVTLQRLRQLTRVSDVARIEAAIAELQGDYKDRGIALQQVSGGYQFRTNTAFSSWVQQLIAGRPVRLSRAQLETLAIVAYRQPITRPEIDEIRGVDSSNTLRLLLERSLIRVLGKREEVGRPTLYGTTKEFLDFFSLGDLRELPTLREYSELTAESRQVMSDRLGVPLDANGELEPEISDELDPDQLEPDSASIVDSILAEHAAAEAEAEARFDARDGSAIAEAAMSGGSSFGHVTDDDAMSLSGGEMSTIGSRLPASEARSYVDAIRASVVESDELSDGESADSMSTSDEHGDSVATAAGETTSAKSNVHDESHVGDDDSESMDDGESLDPASMSAVSDSVSPHVETGGSMLAPDAAHVGHADSESIDVSESMSAEFNPHVETGASMLASDEAHVGHADSESVGGESLAGQDESMSAVSGSIDPHVEPGDSMLASDEAHVDLADAASGSIGAGETTSAKSNVDDSESMSVVSGSTNPHVETNDSMLAFDEAHVGLADSESIDVESLDSESMSINPHVEPGDSLLASDEPHVGLADSASIDPHVETALSDESPLGHGASRSAADETELDAGAPNGPQSDGDTNSGESDLDVEAHVGHNAPVNREPDDNDPESSGS